MKRHASAIWNGSLKDGRGSLTTDSRVLSTTPYSFATRFESGTGTNPEELIAAAHAGCFSMFLSAILSDAGHVPTQISTSAKVHLGAGPKIDLIELSTSRRSPRHRRRHLPRIRRKSQGRLSCLSGPVCC